MNSTFTFLKLISPSNHHGACFEYCQPLLLHLSLITALTSMCLCAIILKIYYYILILININILKTSLRLPISLQFTNPPSIFQILSYISIRYLQYFLYIIFITITCLIPISKCINTSVNVNKCFLHRNPCLENSHHDCTI